MPSGPGHRRIDSAAPRPAPGDETAEHHVDRAREPIRDQAEHDVLGETPGFRQDAPDHDRLWFEQRPPRDFKFDS